MTTKKLSDQAKENLDAAEAKAAEDNPAGSTEHSGAAPGIRVEDDPSLAADAPATFETPKATVKAQEQAHKRLDEVRALQRDAHNRNFRPAVADVVETVFADVGDSKSPGSLTIAQVGSEVILTTTKNELRFTREGALSLQRAITHLASAL